MLCQDVDRSGESYTGQAFPEFFQADTEEARIAQVEWLEAKLGLNEDFFAKILAVDPLEIRGWLAGKQQLHPECIQRLQGLWRMFGHMFSLLNFDYSLIRALVEAKVDVPAEGIARRFEPAWGGDSIRHYLEKGGASAIEEVNCWITSFRFADRYA